MRNLTFHERLGRGGYGDVYRATLTQSLGFQRTIAVKVLREELHFDDQATQRLQDEAQWLSLLHHPAIPPVYDIVSIGQRLALMMKFIDGEDLEHLLHSDDPPPVCACLEGLASVADALHVAANTRVGHEKTRLSLMHRDIKPSNLRLNKMGQLYLLDFGMARSSCYARQALTGGSQIIGTPGYVAPECFYDQSTHASDIFSLGAVLYEVLAGRKLFEKASLLTLARLASCQTHFDDAIAKALERVPHRYISARQLLQPMLAFSPASRPSAAKVKTALRQLSDALGSISLRAWARGRKWQRLEPFRKGLLSGRTLHLDVQSLPAEDELSPTLPPASLSTAQWPRVIACSIAIGFVGSLVLSDSTSPATSPHVSSMAMHRFEAHSKVAVHLTEQAELYEPYLQHEDKAYPLPGVVPAGTYTLRAHPPGDPPRTYQKVEVGFPGPYEVHCIEASCLLQ